MGTLEQGSTTVVERVAEHVRARIARERLPRGAPLPTYRDLMDEVGVAFMTVKRGMDLLASQGIIARDGTRGSFVNRELSPVARPLKKIGIIYPASSGLLFSNGYTGQIMQGLTGARTHHDLHIFSVLQEGLAPASRVAEHGVDGVLFLGVENDDYLRQFTSWGLPGVVVDYCSPDLPLNCIACDNADGARTAVRHLVDLGHRRILYLEWKADRIIHLESKAEKPAKAGEDTNRRIPMRSSDAIERREAALGALAEVPGCRWRTLDFDIVSDSAVPSLVRELAARWRAEPDRPTAVIASDESLADLMILALTELGVEVPREVSVCAVSGAGVVLRAGVPIAQSRFDFTGMGRKALELLRQRCEHPDEAPSPKVHRIGFEWMEGSTCGACA
jgi:DNA-binding LacI/PurR family transcriptional regulator